LLMAGLALLAAAILLATFVLPGAYRALPALSPDSETYLDWNVGRAPAYPLALSVMRRFSSDVAWIGWTQFVALVASTSVLSLTFFSTFRSQLAALALAGAILAHPQVVSYAFAVLPESLFMSVLILHLACVLNSIRGGRWPLIGVSTTLAVLILLKPSAYALLACLPLLVIHRRNEWRSALVRVAVPVFVILGVVSIANLMARGYFAPQSQGGYSLVAHVGAFVDPGDRQYPALSAGIAADAAPHRAALEGIRSLHLYYLFSSHDYHELERIVRRRIAAESESRRGVAVTDHRQFPDDAALLQDLTDMGSHLARRAIVAHPTQYARHVFAQLYGLWMLPLIQPASAVPQLRAALHDIRAQSADLDRSEVAFRPVPFGVFVGVRLLLAAALVTSIGSAVSYLRGMEAAHWLPPAYAGVAVHANYLLVAAVQPGLPRYALVMWPAIVVVLMSVAALAVARYRS
jgi:hypothetical protein